MNKTMRNRVPECLMLTGLIFLLAGCSPPQYSLVAVRMSAKGPVSAILQPCSNDHVGRVTLRRLGEDVDHTPGLKTWEKMPPESAKGKLEIDILHPPDGWTGSAEPSDKLAKNVKYSLVFVVGGPNGEARYRGKVYFADSDLENLKAGEVWADNKSMTLEDFGKMTADRCG